MLWCRSASPLSKETGETVAVLLDISFGKRVQNRSQQQRFQAQLANILAERYDLIYFIDSFNQIQTNIIKLFSKNLIFLFPIPSLIIILNLTPIHSFFLLFFPLPRPLINIHIRQDSLQYHIYLMKKFLPLVLFLILAAGAPAEDEVDFPIAGYNNHKWYSGFLNFSTGAFHYVFFDSQRDPDNDPVVLWLNGGPGCSSLIGMLLENGPFVFVRNTTSIKLNDFSWNKKANVLYLESPGGVGFSKSFRNNNFTYNDPTTTEDNYKALTDFFRKFPNLKKNDFYISGESYAGIYVPYLANEILEKNKLPNTEVKINLKGILVGNACTDPRQCYEPSSDGQDSMSIYQYQYLNNHAYIIDDDYSRITGACTLGYNSAECKRLRAIQDKKFDATQTVINNIYQPCYHQKIPFAPVPQFLQSRRKNSLRSGLKDFETCEDLKGIYHFLNEPTMQVHLHVDFTKYQICSDVVSDNYKMNSNASYWLYPILIKAGLRVWIYSGDVDANVPITGTLRWIQLMKDVNGLPVVEPWREWWAPGLHKHEDQMAGMVWKLRGFTFVSVKGAGHMVPSDKPKEAQILLESFINNADLPYNSD